jgi:hypothetical protein
MSLHVRKEIFILLFRLSHCSEVRDFVKRRWCEFANALCNYFRLCLHNHALLALPGNVFFQRVAWLQANSLTNEEPS